jgi:hypothetical protein
VFPFEEIHSPPACALVVLATLFRAQGRGIRFAIPNSPGN